MQALKTAVDMRLSGTRLPCRVCVAVGRSKPFHSTNDCVFALLRPLTAVISAGDSIMHVILPDDSEAYAGS
jgi:hypothetical protein